MKIALISLVCTLVCLTSEVAFSSNLFKERIWKLSDTKKSIFLDQGVFHHELANKTNASGIKSVRNSYVASRGFERIVFDFTSEQLPRIYGHLSQKNKKISIDFYKTSLANGAANIQNSKFIKGMDFYTVDADLLTTEIDLSQEASFDVFYLSNPTRLVIDIKKL